MRSFEGDIMAIPTPEQRELYQRLNGIIKDTAFLRAVMVFAISLKSERVLIDAIDEGALTNEQDFYDLIELSFQDSQAERAGE